VEIPEIDLYILREMLGSMLGSMPEMVQKFKPG